MVVSNLRDRSVTEVKKGTVVTALVDVEFGMLFWKEKKPMLVRSSTSGRWELIKTGEILDNKNAAYCELANGLLDKKEKGLCVDFSCIEEKIA